MKCFVERRKYWLAALSCCLMDYYRCCTRSRLQQEFKPPARTPEGTSVHISLQPALHKIQQKAPIEWTAENILQYDAEQYNLSDVSIREHFLCSSRKTAAICPSFYLYFTVLVSSSMRSISVQFGLTNWISRHDFCWFTCLRFGYFCICVITLLCDSAFKHMLISSFLHCKVERCLTSLWFCVILYLFLLYFCIYVFVYFSILVDCIGGWSGDKVEQPGGFLSSSIVSQDRLIITKSPALDCFLLNMWGGGGWWWWWWRCIQRCWRFLRI